MSTATRPGLNDPVGVALSDLLDQLAGAAPIRVVDVGGGSGTRAVPLAVLGCHVTVVDSSIDALAILRRRAAEAGVLDRVVAVQADADRLASEAEAGSVDLVLCHHVLQEFHSRSEAQAVAGQIAEVLRPGGRASIVVPSRLASVFALGLAGRYQQAAAVLNDPDGRSGPTDPVAHRFDADELDGLLSAAGLTVESIKGFRVVTDLLPGAVRLYQDNGERADLAALEAALSNHPVTNRLGADLHAVAGVPGDRPGDPPS